MTFICSIRHRKNGKLVECSESFKTFEELLDHVDEQQGKNRGWITVYSEEPLRSAQ